MRLGTAAPVAGILLGAGGVIAFSIRPVLIKLAYAYVTDPVTLLALRMIFSLPFFIAAAVWAARREGARPLRPRDWIIVAALGSIGYYLASFLDFLGLQYVGAGLGRLILFLYPTMVLLLSFVFLRKAPTRRELLALVICYTGVAFILSNRLGGESIEGRLYLLGVLFIFGSALSYAIYLVAGSQMVKRVGSMRFTAYTMIISTLPAVAQFFVMEPLAALRLPAAVWVYAIVMATFSTVLPVFLQAEALKRIGASHFALLGALGPLSTALLSVVGLEERFGPLQSLGAALVIAGVLLVSVKRS